MIALLRCGIVEETRVVDAGLPSVHRVPAPWLKVMEATTERGPWSPEQLVGRPLWGLLDDGWRFPRRAMTPVTTTLDGVLYLYLEYPS